MSILSLLCLFLILFGLGGLLIIWRQIAPIAYSCWEQEQALLATPLIGVVILNKAQQIQQANVIFGEMMGILPEALQGTYWPDLTLTSAVKQKKFWITKPPYCKPKF